MALLEVRHSFERVAGESGVGAAKADCDQQSPLGIGQYAFGGPDEEKPKQERTGHVDDQSPVGEIHGAEFGDDAAQEVPQIRA